MRIIQIPSFTDIVSFFPPVLALNVKHFFQNYLDWKKQWNVLQFPVYYATMPQDSFAIVSPAHAVSDCAWV